MTQVWSQVKISGIVFSKDDNSPLPGVNVMEKGTRNGTATAGDGTFSLSVADVNSTLEFSFVGYVSEEVQLNGRNKISVTLKPECIRDYFDTNTIRLYAKTGVINTPAGGQFEVALPYFSKGTLNTGISYQTNFGKNQFLTTLVEFKHFVWSCNFDMDVNWYYRKVSFGTAFNSRAYSFEPTLGLGRLRLITGYSNLYLSTTEANAPQSFSGVMLGMGTWVGGPLRISLTGKVAIYQGREEYLAQLIRNSRHVDLIACFYKVDSFNEFSLGIGTKIYYRLKKAKSK